MKALMKVVLVGAGFMLGGCGNPRLSEQTPPPPALLKETGSGQAEAVCEGSREQVRDMLVERFTSKGWTIEETTGTVVRASRMSDNRGVRGRYELMEHDGGVRVIGTAQLVSHSSSGEKVQELNSNAARNNIQEALWDMGCK